MKTAIALSIGLISSIANASVTTFTCTLTKHPKDAFTFKMKNLGTSKVTFLMTEDSEWGVVFVTKAKKGVVNHLVETLNGQGGDLRNYKDKIEFFGDSAGIDFAYLGLYKNSGYTKGYASMEFNFGEERRYSEVHCKLVKE